MKRSFNSMLWQLFVVVIVVLFAPQVVSAQTVDELKRNAEQGNADAQNDLGICYFKGQGVTQDYVEAVKWYRKSAEQGNADAQYNLGFCYENGHGVTKDLNEAIEWYRKAAQQGIEYAKLRLNDLGESW